MRYSQVVPGTSLLDDLEGFDADNSKDVNTPPSPIPYVPATSVETPGLQSVTREVRCFYGVLGCYTVRRDTHSLPYSGSSIRPSTSLSSHDSSSRTSTPCMSFGSVPYPSPLGDPPSPVSPLPEVHPGDTYFPEVDVLSPDKLLHFLPVGPTASLTLSLSVLFCSLCPPPISSHIPGLVRNLRHNSLEESRYPSVTSQNWSPIGLDKYTMFLGRSVSYLSPSLSRTYPTPVR